MNEINRPVIRYYGGKWRMAKWIIQFFPKHQTYVEPFCGAASVFFRKMPAMFEILNDIDGDIVNFFNVLRQHPYRLIESILATPYSRNEFNRAFEKTNDPIEKARRYYIISWQGFHGGAKSQKKYTGWRYQHSNNRGKSVVDDWNTVEHLPLIVERLKNAFIENDDALNVIERYDKPHTLFYIDPPYLAETRSKRWAKVGYRHEIDESYHEKLLQKILSIRGMVIISGYDSELYNDLLGGWTRIEKSFQTTNVNKSGREVLWLSFNINGFQEEMFKL